MSIYEAEVRDLLSSKYAVFERTEHGFTPMVMRTEEGEFEPAPFYDALASINGVAKRRNPSDYWDGEGFHHPGGNIAHLSCNSKRTVKYGFLEAEGKLPDLTGLDDGSGFWLGFELAGPPDWGIATFHWEMRAGAEQMEIIIAGSGYGQHVNVTDIIPGDVKTTSYMYSVMLNRSSVEFYIDRDLAGVVIFNTGISNILYENTEPYAVSLINSRVPPHQPTLIEAYPRKNGEPVELDVEFPINHFRWTEGQAAPPRTFRLKDAGASTLLTEGTYDTGVSHKSHPVPTAGYRAKGFLFQADTDSTADGLAVEVFTQDGNWRTYLSRTYSANTLESIEPTGEFPLMRLAYEPSADGASITDAEVTVK